MYRGSSGILDFHETLCVLSCVKISMETLGWLYSFPMVRWIPSNSPGHSSEGSTCLHINGHTFTWIMHIYLAIFDSDVVTFVSVAKMGIRGVQACG